MFLSVWREFPLAPWFAGGKNLMKAGVSMLLKSRRKNSRSWSDDWHRWRFWSAFRNFGTHFAESFCMSKSSWMMDPDPTRSREMPICSAIDLAEIRRSSKISSWIWSIISGVVTVLGRPGRGASQVEKSPRLNWATQFLTVVDYGACSRNVSFRMAWISFCALPCRKKKTWWQLACPCCWNRAHRLTCFLSASVTKRTCNSAHEQTSLSNDVIDSVLRYREVCRAKDLSAPVRVCVCVYPRVSTFFAQERCLAQGSKWIFADNTG